MLNEYNCWLQERKIEPKIKVPEIVYAEEGGEIAKQAAVEFVNGIKRLLGFSPEIKFIKSDKNETDKKKGRKRGFSGVNVRF